MGETVAEAGRARQQLIRNRFLRWRAKSGGFDGDDDALWAPGRQDESFEAVPRGPDASDPSGRLHWGKDARRETLQTSAGGPAGSEKDSRHAGLQIKSGAGPYTAIAA